MGRGIMTKKEFVDEIGWFCEHYATELTDSQLKTWGELVGKGNTVDQLHRALMNHLAESDNPFLPAVGTIKKGIDKIKRNEPEENGYKHGEY